MGLRGRLRGAGRGCLRGGAPRARRGGEASRRPDRHPRRLLVPGPGRRDRGVRRPRALGSTRGGRRDGGGGLLQAGGHPVGGARLRQHALRPARLPPPLLPAGPSSPRPLMGNLFEQARILVVRGELPAAHRVLDAVLLEEPTPRGALLLQAPVLLDERDRPRALAVLDGAARAWPPSAEARHERARFLHAIGDHVAALAPAGRAPALLDGGWNGP